MQRFSRAFCNAALLPSARWLAICQAAGTEPSRTTGQNSTQRSLSSTAGHDKLQGSCYILRMPQMSPAMESGRVVKWHKAIGDAIEEEDLIADIATDSLAEKGHDVGQWSGEVVMQVECHDDGYLAKTFAGPASGDSAGDEGCRNAGEDLPCGVPLALICESQDDVQEVQGMPGDARAVLEAVGDAVRRDATWQAFVRS